MLQIDGIRSVVESTFQSSQINTDSHRALSVNLKATHLECLHTENSIPFERCFFRCLDRLLTTSRKDQCANRVVDFVAAYCKLICPEDADQSGEIPPDDDFEHCVVFVEAIIERYLPGFSSRLAQVRYRCISLVGTLVPLAPLNEALLSKLEGLAIERLRDSDFRVRVQAVVLVSRFDLSPATTRALATAMQHDPSAEVRLVATYNIAHGSRELTEIACERVRDLAPQIRRGMYLKVLRTIDFRALSIRARETIVRAGVNDRDESVKRAASMLVANRWVSMSDNNIELVLQRLDVIGHTDIADLVLSTFFNLRRDVVEQLTFEESFWAELWIEDCVLLRGFQEFCLREHLEELLDDQMPELTRLAEEIESLWRKYTDPQTYEAASSEDEADDLRECLPFMIEQLLQVASRYELVDEASRQRLTAVINEIIMADNAPSAQTIEHIVSIQRTLNASDTALVSWAFETLEAIPSSASQATDAAIITGILRSLSLFNAVLARVSSHDVAAYLPSLYSSYVQPAMRSPVSEIRVPALKCLGLACLLDHKFAREHVGEFVTLITENGDRQLHPASSSEQEEDDGDAQEMVTAIGAMTDMLLAHTEQEFPRETVAKLWISLLASRNPTVHGCAALSLAKLLLANLLDDPRTALERLITFYFENTHGVEDDESRALTQQQIALFLRAYCLFEEGKELLATVFPMVSKLYLTYRKGDKKSITLGELANQVLELTLQESGAKARTESEITEEPSDDPSTWHHPHAQIAVAIVRLQFAAEDVSARRSLIASLNKVVLDGAPPEACKQIKRELESQGDLQEIPTATIRSGLINFHGQIAQRLTESSELERLQSTNNSILGGVETGVLSSA